MRRVATLLIVLVAAVAALLGGRTRVERIATPTQLDEMTLASAHAAVPASLTQSAAWCGTTSTTDRAPVYTGYPIHVLYAMPADGADQSATFAPQISDWIDQVDAWWSREDPSRLPRFDMYQAPCGPQVDLQVVRIPSASVATTDPDTLFQLVWTQLAQQPDAPTTKYLVFIDDVNTGDVCGVGAPASTSVVGAPSFGLATVMLAACNGADRATIAAHELLHSVSPAAGLVGAPHTCPGDLYHVCDSSGDVLYPFVESGIPLNSLQLDVGHDDYWAGTAPVNLQVQPWFRHVQDEVHLGLSIAGAGTVESNLPGVDCTATCGTDWDRGDAIQLSAAPATGDRFVQWTGACSGSTICSLTLDTPKDVSAQFAPSTYALAVHVAGSGAVTSNPSGLACRLATCSKPFPSYQPVLLTAKPAKNWRFVAWSGGCHGAKTTCRLAMTAPSSVRAVFAKKKPVAKKHPAKKK